MLSTHDNITGRGGGVEDEEPSTVWPWRPTVVEKGSNTLVLCYPSGQLSGADFRLPEILEKVSSE